MQLEYIFFIGLFWGIGGLLWWLSTRPPEYSVYDHRRYQKPLYENRAEHHTTITGERMKTFEKISFGVYRILKPEGITQALADWSDPTYNNQTGYFKYVNGVPRTFPVTVKFERKTVILPTVFISIINTPD